MTLAIIILAGLLGIFGHWVTRWKQKRTTSTFGAYIMTYKVETFTSICSNVIASMSLYMANPEVEGNSLLMLIITAYTAGFTLDSALNKDANYVTNTPPKQEPEIPASKDKDSFSSRLNKHRNP